MIVKGFVLAAKPGLDLQQMKVVLRKLAQFHASSAIYYEKHGKFDEKFSRGVYNHGMQTIFDESYDYNFSFIVDNIFSTWTQLDKSIIIKMVRIVIYIFNQSTLLF